MAVPDESDKPAPGHVGLIVLDMINPMEFEEGDELVKQAEKMTDRILALREAAHAAGVPVVYVNDNYEKWRADPDELVAYCTQEGAPGAHIVERLRPGSHDYFVIKPQFSGFYSTTLPVLLPKLGVQRLILTGVTADICVLFTAGDAHMRAYDLWVPRDCVASFDPRRTEWALDIMEHAMGACTRASDEMCLSDWIDQE